MTPQNKFKAIVTAVFGGFILLVAVSLMIINSQKQKNTEYIVKNNAELNTNIKSIADINLSAELNSEKANKTQNDIIQNIDNNTNINNTAVITDKQNISNSKTNNINTSAINSDFTSDLSNSTNSQNLNNTNNLSTNLVNSDVYNSNINTNSVNLPTQIVSLESLEIAKLQNRITDLESKIAKQNNMNHSKLNSSNKNLSSKLKEEKNNPIQKQHEKQTVLAVIGNRARVKDNNNDMEYTVAKGEKIQNSAQVKYIEAPEDVIIYSSTH